MASQQPSVSVTSDALIIRIPWGAVDIRHVEAPSHKRHLTVHDVLEFVEAGRLAHRLGKTRSVESLKALSS